MNKATNVASSGSSYAPVQRRAVPRGVSRGLLKIDHGGAPGLLVVLLLFLKDATGTCSEEGTQWDLRSADHIVLFEFLPVGCAWTISWELFHNF